MRVSGVEGASTGTLLQCCHAVGERLEQVLTAYH
jgi:hypothetical protein